MNNKWGNKEVQESARTLTAALSPVEEKCLEALPGYFQDDREPTEILGEIFEALKKQYPSEYRVAFKRAITKKCKDCGEAAKRRSYCNRHYHIHYKAGDFG